MNMEDFELQKERRLDLNKKVWVPIWASINTEIGEYFFAGHKKTFLYRKSFLVPVDKKEIMTDLTWNDRTRDLVPFYNGDKYIKSTEILIEDEVIEPLVVNHVNHEKRKLFILPDFIISLRLREDGDSWVFPEKFYEEVIKITKNEEDNPILVEVKAEYLKDYLSARKCGLFIDTYIKNYIEDECDYFGNDYKIPNGIKTETYDWETFVSYKHEGTILPWGEEMMVMQTGIDKMDYDDDIPQNLDLQQDKTYSKTKSIGARSRKIACFSSELRKKDWIEPSAISQIVLREDKPITLQFIINEKGETKTSEELKGEYVYLWFSPKVITNILANKGVELVFYTRDTGGIKTGAYTDIHFGMNQLGLINVLAEDLSRTPECEQKIWVGNNLGPDGGVSKELLLAQGEARPARSFAPEMLICDFLTEFKNNGILSKIYRDIPSWDVFSKDINRFIATDFDGLCLLSSELNKYLLESIDKNELKNMIINPQVDNFKNLGSLKLLEILMKEKGLDVSKISVMFDIYDMRILEGHKISQSKKEDVMKKINCSEESNFILISMGIMDRVVSFLEELLKIR